MRAGKRRGCPRRRDKLLKAADELATRRCKTGVRGSPDRRCTVSTGQQQPRPTPARALSKGTQVFEAVFGAVRGPLTRRGGGHDEEVYLCSERTMYRVLAFEVPVQERRAQRTHPEYEARLMATAPNQVWSWDAAARADGAITTSTSSWISTAATSWAGSTGRTRPWPAG